MTLKMTLKMTYSGFITSEWDANFSNIFFLSDKSRTHISWALYSFEYKKSFPEFVKINKQ